MSLSLLVSSVPKSIIMKYSLAVELRCYWNGIRVLLKWSQGVTEMELQCYWNGVKVLLKWICAGHKQEHKQGHSCGQARVRVRWPGTGKYRQHIFSGLFRARKKKRKEGIGLLCSSSFSVAFGTETDCKQSGGPKPALLLVVHGAKTVVNYLAIPFILFVW